MTSFILFMNIYVWVKLCLETKYKVPNKDVNFPIKNIINI